MITMIIVLRMPLVFFFVIIFTFEKKTVLFFIYEDTQYDTL